MTACPSHKACEIVNGQTIHRLFDINPVDYSHGYKKVKQLQSDGIKYILLDEISMISERMLGVLSQIKALFNFVFVGFGDFKQLKPINEEHVDFKNSWIVKFVFNNTLCELEKYTGSMIVNYYKTLTNALMAKQFALRSMVKQNTI